MSAAIKLEKCVLEGIESKKKNGLIVSRLKFIALFDRAAAKAIGAEYTVFTKDAEIRTTYTEMQLDFTMPELKLNYVVKGLEDRPLDIRSQGAEKFVLKRKGDGKKKATKLMVQFRVIHIGHYLELTSWWEAQGGTEGIITLTPQQAELPLSAAPPAPQKPKPVQTELKEFPKPNENGVYAETGGFKSQLKLPSGSYGRVTLLQIGESRWAHAISLELTNETGHSTPLNDDIVHFSQADALRSGMRKLIEAFEPYATGKKPSASRRAVQDAKKLLVWAKKQFEERNPKAAAAGKAVN
jgi:hypothetical protein